MNSKVEFLEINTIMIKSYNPKVRLNSILAKMKE